MNYVEFCTKFGIEPNVFKKAAPGVGVLSPLSSNLNKGTITITGAAEQYMYVIFNEDECCVSVGSYEMRRLLTFSNQDRTQVLDYLNSILETIGAPIQYLFNEEHNVLLMYNKVTRAWSFRLDYTYKTPGYNAKGDIIRVDPTYWQTRSRARASNSLEGKFNPDAPLEDNKINDAVKLIVENI